MLNRYYYQSSGAAPHGSDTLYPTIADYIQADDPTTYATAADGGSPGVTSTTTFRVGQLYSSYYFCWETFLAFDLSDIPSGATITDATLSLDLYSDYLTTDFTLYVAVYDFGASVDTGDFRTRAQLAALTPVASTATSGHTEGGGYVACVDEGSGLAAALVPGVVNRLILWSSRHEASTAPTGNEYGYWNGIGSAAEPKLEVTW